MKKNKEQGSVIIYALLTMSVMLAIGLALNTLFLGKLRIAAAVRNAAVALYVADSGAELCLYEARTQTDDPPFVFESGAQLTITSLAVGNPDITDDCSGLGSSSFQFRSTGTYRTSARALEITQ